MKTKKKTFVALLATFAVGTAAVAGLALSKSGNDGFIAHAETAQTASVVSLNSVSTASTVQVGTNTVALQAGEEKVLTLSVANAGSYGFKWVSGSASFRFEGLTESVEDENEDEDEADEVYEAYTYGLNSGLTSFYVVVATPDTATVIVTADEDTTIVFEVSYLIDTGTNHISLEAGVSQTFALNSNLVGTYEFGWVAGAATMTISGVGTYTLSESNPTVSVDLSTPSSTEITFASATDVELSFTLTYSAEYTDLVIGSNSLTLTANDVQHCIIGSGVVGQNAPTGYYTFTRTSGSARVTLLIGGQEQTITLNAKNTSFTAYIVSPSATVIEIYWTSNISFNFDISYSETDPNAGLSLGAQTVNASAWGEEYTFTAASDGTYTLTCYDANAYIMAETEYGAEEINIYYDDNWDISYSDYTFTLSAGETIRFYMCTNDWNDDTYEVIIAVADNN